MFEIIELSIGKPKPLKNTKINSSIDRDVHPQALICHKEEITGDKVELLKYHGGPDRVLHQYPQEHYDYWKTQYAEHKDIFIPGSIGENMLTTGITEKDVRIGDIVRIGTVLAQVTEPRKPCGTIDKNYGIKGMFKRVEREVRCGWFYRILEPGEIRIGDDVILEEKGPEEFDLHTVMIKSLMETNDLSYLLNLKNYLPLSERWRERIVQLLGQ